MIVKIRQTIQVKPHSVKIMIDGLLVLQKIEIYMGDGETYRRFLTWGVTWLSHRELSVGNEEHRGAKRWLETGVSKRRVRFEVEAGHYRFGR